MGLVNDYFLRIPGFIKTALFLHDHLMNDIWIGFQIQEAPREHRPPQRLIWGMWNSLAGCYLWNCLPPNMLKWSLFHPDQSCFGKISWGVFVIMLLTDREADKPTEMKNISRILLLKSVGSLCGIFTYQNRWGLLICETLVVIELVFDKS